MAVVLVLGVQGIADAITEFTKTSSQTINVSINQSFTITFSVKLQPSKRIANTDGTGYVDQDNKDINKDGYFLDSNGYYKTPRISP